MNRHGSKWIRPAKRHAIYRRDAFRCAYCGDEVTPKNWTLDHIVPRSKGGTNEASNLVTAHVSCNSSRGCRELDTRQLRKFRKLAARALTF